MAANCRRFRRFVVALPTFVFFRRWRRRKKKTSVAVFRFFSLSNDTKKGTTRPEIDRVTQQQQQQQKNVQKKTQIKKSSTDLVDAADAREDAGDLR